jgi:hypothetical protein
MIKKICLAVFLMSFVCIEAQNLSNSETKEINKTLDKAIKEISSQNLDEITLIRIYQMQIQQAESIIKKYETHKSDAKISESWLCLKTLCEQNKPIVDYIEQNMSQILYSKGVNALKVKKNVEDAARFFNLSVKEKPKNVMANVEIAMLKLDSNKINEAYTILYKVISEMNPSENQRELCLNTMSFAYNSTMITALSMIKDGKFADAESLLIQLKTACERDNFSICNAEIVDANIEKCRKGIYNDHLVVTKRAIDLGKTEIAAAFIGSTYDYISRNNEDIKQTSDFDSLASLVINSYIQTAKTLTAATQNEARMELLQKARTLSGLIGGQVEAKALKDIAVLTGTINLSDPKLDSIEENTPVAGYSDMYEQYINDTLSDNQSAISNIEKDYITSSNNRLPSKSVAVEQTKTQSLRKEIDDKFYEVRSFISVSSYDKALEVLDKANRLARIEGEKKEVEKMYLAAIREITARRMSEAEYSVFQGNITKADSLVSITQDLLTTYKMSEDREIKRIMNSYLLSLDKKVCDKKQEEINVAVNNILDCINRNDFSAANQHIEKAIGIKGSSQCRIDKSRIRALKRQIDKPLEYVDAKEKVMEALEDEQDTMKFIFGYAGLEQFYVDNYLIQMNVHHQTLRELLYNWGDDRLTIKAIEYLMKYRKFEVALSLVGTLKDFGYKKKHTKDIQQKLGEMIALENMKNVEKVELNHRLNDRYQSDKWFSYFNKSYTKNYDKWKKENKFSFD